VKRWMNRMHLSARGARVHFAVAVALISVIPCLTLFYLYSLSAGSRPLTLAQWCVAALGIAGAMVFGYALLGRYPATIIRLRAYLHDVVKGELPDAVDLSASEQDITAIEEALNVVLEKLRQKLHEVKVERTRLEDELFQARKLEAIGTLAAGIAHEINTPLQFVSNNVQFLEKACRELSADLDQAPDRAKTHSGARDNSEQTPAKREFLRAELPRAFKQLAEGIARISQIVRAIRNFAKADSDGIKVSVDLNKAVETTLEVTRNEWKYHAAVETDLDPALPPVLCFPAEIKRTLMELILNAVQAIVASRPQSGREQGIIRVTTRLDGQETLLAVSDDGCGIPADIRDCVFDPFFTTREIGAGAGCGLAFAHAAVVNRHGGRLSFITEENKGSTFTVALPMVAEIKRGGPAREERRNEQLQRGAQ